MQYKTNPVLYQHAERHISFTSDLWSNLKLTSFMAITAHFVARDERGNLIVRSRLIAFRMVSGSHTGVNLAGTFFNILKEYGLLHKVRCFQCLEVIGSITQVQTSQVTLDNASNNDTFMRELQRLFTEIGVPFDHEQNRIRYVYCNFAIRDFRL